MVSRTFRDVTRQMRFDAVFFASPDQLVQAKASGVLGELVEKVEHITVRPIPMYDTSRGRITAPDPAVCAALRSLQLQSVDLKPPLPSLLPALKSLRLSHVMIARADLEGWLSPTVLPSLRALSIAHCWSQPDYLPAGTKAPYFPTLSPLLVSQLSALQAYPEFKPNPPYIQDGVPLLLEVHDYSRLLPLARHVVVIAFSTTVDAPQGALRALSSPWLRSISVPLSARDAFLADAAAPLGPDTIDNPLDPYHPNRARRAARSVLEQCTARSIDVVWYDDEGGRPVIGEELICREFWEYAKRVKADGV
ncbi:hypothetical protein JCM10450v2_006292 [Rhodotorula kratochvilovae]